jgi:hypothetical protein
MTAKQAEDSSDNPGSEEDKRISWAVAQIKKALRDLQFGQVCVTVQDGTVVQVERTERFRYQRRSVSH